MHRVCSLRSTTSAWVATSAAPTSPRSTRSSPGSNTSTAPTRTSGARPGSTGSRSSTIEPTTAPTLAAGSPIVGRVEATLYDGRPGEAEVAYVFGPRWWGRGLATEATRWMLDHLHHRYGVSTCWATVDPANSAPRAGCSNGSDSGRPSSPSVGWAATTTATSCTCSPEQAAPARHGSGVIASVSATRVRPSRTTRCSRTRRPVDAGARPTPT